METLLFVLFLGMIVYGFIMSRSGRDLIETAVGRRTEDNQPAPRRSARHNLPAKESIPNRRESFGLRQR
jgi:hypothetical protein